MSSPEFAPLERAPAYKLVYDAIEKEIHNGRLKVGDKLPSETTLAEQFGVNRSTIREGIRLLEQGGLIQREGGKRPRVSLPHYLDLASRATRALVLHSVTFRELWEASVLLEPATAELAANRITARHLEDLESNLRDMGAAVERVENNQLVDVADFVTLDSQFHEILAHAAGNRVLALSREPVSRLFIPAGRVILPRLRSHRRVLDAHNAIYEALRDGEIERVREWMKRHMEDFKRGYEATGMDLDMPLDLVAIGSA
jgi:DNA-binding FadR family transcriptional regulator